MSTNHVKNIKLHQPAIRLRGGGTDATPAPTPPPQKRVRIPSLDSMRFLFITCIVCGHFIRFASPSDFWFKFFSQHNVIVGAFFALSGYVTAYTSTEVGLPKASPKLTDTPSQEWILSRVFGYFPLHLATLLLFSPLFVYVDMYYSGIVTTLRNAILSVTMTQSWFPNLAEIWNAPTWFLSALTFITCLMPFGLPKIAEMDKKALKKTGFYIFLINALPRLAYCTEFNAWKIVEGVTSPKAHPNYAAFNMQRFNPLLLAAEVFMGAVAARIVMMDSASDKEKPPKTNALSTAVPFISMVGIMIGRATGHLVVSDMIARLVYVPLVLKFFQAAHRNTVNGCTDPTLAFLNQTVLVWLGGLAFPIYIVHGPIGQIFYKKLIAVKLWGAVQMGPQKFGFYLGTVGVAAWILQQLVLKSATVKDWSQQSVKSLSSKM